MKVDVFFLYSGDFQQSQSQKFTRGYASIAVFLRGISVDISVFFLGRTSAEGYS